MLRPRNVGFSAGICSMDCARSQCKRWAWTFRSLTPGQVPWGGEGLRRAVRTSANERVTTPAKHSSAKRCPTGALPGPERQALLPW